MSISIHGSHLYRLTLHFLRDLHGLRLDSLNAILSFAGFATLTNIKQFDLTQFKEKAEKLKAQEGPKTEKQVLFLKYFAN